MLHTVVTRALFVAVLYERCVERLQVAIEVFHQPPCQSVQCNYRHIYGIIIIYSNLWFMLLTGICLEVTLGS